MAMGKERMPTNAQSTKEREVFRLITPAKKRASSVISIRGIGWFSLLKLLLIGYAFGSLPFIALLNYAAFSAPDALSEEMKKAISLPTVLVIWPITVFFAAWFTNFFVCIGLRIFGSVRPLKITVFIDEKTEPIQSATDNSGAAPRRV